MEKVLCSRGDCRKEIKPKQVVYYIRNQPQNAPPHDHRPYCRECGKGITDFSTSIKDGLVWRREIHVELTSTEELLLMLYYTLSQKNPNISRSMLERDAVANITGSSLAVQIARQQVEDVMCDLIVAKKKLKLDQNGYLRPNHVPE